MRARRRQAAGRGSSKERDRNRTNRQKANTAGHPDTGAGLDTVPIGTGFGTDLGGMGVRITVAEGRTGVEEATGRTVVLVAVGVIVGVAWAGGRGMITQAEALPVFPKESQTRTLTSYLPTYAIEPSPMRPNQENLPGRFEPL